MAGNNANMTDIAAQLGALKDSLSSIKGSLEESRTELKSMNSQNTGIKEKLKNLDFT